MDMKFFANWGRALLSVCREHLLSLGLFLAVLGLMISGLTSVQEESRQEGRRIVEESITRAIVSCYAIEGIYPEDLSYLQDNYGLVVDEKRYYVQYEIFASNIMPEVTVIEVGT